MSWRPSLAELTAPMTRPRSWSLSLEPYGRGIDNARVDCALGDRFRERASETLRKLVRETLAGGSRRSTGNLGGADDLDAFRETYVGLFQATLDRHPGSGALDALVLLQLALVKYLIEAAERESQILLGELEDRSRGPSDASQSTDAQEQTVSADLQCRGIRRRALHLVFRQIRALESGQLRSLRASTIGRHWPIRDPILFNPLLLVADPTEERALTADYPIAWLEEAGIGDWLATAESALAETFGEFVETCPGDLADPSTRRVLPTLGTPHRRAQGALRGFIGTEILLERFVPRGEYRSGRANWLDDPANLELLLGTSSAAPIGDAESPRAAKVSSSGPHWIEFSGRVKANLRLRLESVGLHRVLPLVYGLPTLRLQLGLSPPLSLVLDYADGRIPRRRLETRLESLHPKPDTEAAQKGLERLLGSIARQGQELTDDLLGRFLGDFLALRRDLKLAHKTFEILEGIRLLDGDDETRLSRANRSLYEFQCRGELQTPSARRISAHAVVKADVRGSTLITEELRARGLNPASHFSLNFFNPVNSLLPEYGAEKLFVEGDAVILALYEHEDEAAGSAVARACRLARQIIRVVRLQNIRNRQNDLPELELGLGVSFSRREPNFLYDEGRQIMISSAINQADRLSSCSALLRRSGFEPPNPAFRVAVVRDAVGGERFGPGRDLLTYNVNGVKLDEAAVFKLQEEMDLAQVELPDGESEESIFYVGRDTDGSNRTRWLALRHAPVMDWYGDSVGSEDPEGRHYYEMIVDERLMRRLRRLVE